MIWKRFSRNARFRQLAFVLLGVLMASCSPAFQATSTTPTFEATPLTPVILTPTAVPQPGNTDVPTPEIEETDSMPVTGSPFENDVLLAKEDLAGRLGVAVEQIELISAEAVIWPDSGLGCPQPGVAYTQVQQDGLRILLQVGQKEYRYHSGGSRPPFLCENPAEGGTPAPGPGLDS